MTDSIHVLLGRVMGDVLPIGKKGEVRTGNGPNYNFRGVDAVVNAVGPVLRLYKVIVVPEVQSVTYQDVVTGVNRKPGRAAMVTVRYRFMGPAGDEVSAVVAAEAIDSGDKATAKAMAVAWRTALIQVFAIATGDPDPDSATYARSEPLTPESIRDRAVMDTATRGILLQLHGEAKASKWLDTLVVNEKGSEEKLGDLIVRRNNEIPVKKARRRTTMPEPAMELLVQPLSGETDE